MSNKLKQGKKKIDNKNGQKKNKTRLVVYGSVAVIIVVAVIMLYIHNKNKNIEIPDGYGEGEEIVESHLAYDETKDYSGTDITTYKYDSKVLQGEDLEEALTKIYSVLNTIIESNGYVIVQLSDVDFEYYVYNKESECVAQSGDGVVNTIFKNDGSGCIAYNAETGEAVEMHDVHIIRRLMNSIALARTGQGYGVRTFLMETSDIKEAYDNNEEWGQFEAAEYRIDIPGYDAYKRLFISNDGIEGMELRAELDVESLREQLVEQFGEVETAYEYEPHTIINYMIDGNNISIINYLVYNDTEYITWVIDGYLELEDWKLPDSVYDLDIDNTNEEEMIRVTDEVTEEINRVIKIYNDELENNYMEDTYEGSASDSDIDTES